VGSLIGPTDYKPYTNLLTALTPKCSTTEEVFLVKILALPPALENFMKNIIKNNEWWRLPVNEVVKKLASDKERGLSEKEALSRLELYGKNQLPESGGVSVFSLFLNQFSSVIIWILLGALIISGFLGETIDSLAIATIILLNALIGFYQEYRSERSLEALKKMTKPISRVIREGKLQTISSMFLVPGDLVMLEAGDMIPADGRIVSITQLATQEASLTGESSTIGKFIDEINKPDLAIGDRKNMAFMGTVVVRGKGTMIVTETALKTELGEIAQLLTQKEEPTPLQKQLAQVGYQLVFVCIGIVSIIFLLGIFRGNEYIPMLLTALSLAVAAIPEGLPAVVTVALSIGVHRMAKKNAIIRRLLSVETLGGASVICTDKTGTLTKNEMTLQKIWQNGNTFDITGIGYSPEGEYLQNQNPISPDSNADLNLALKIGTLCNGAGLVQNNGQWYIVGDPTEGALLVAAAKAGISKDNLVSEYKFISEIPFDSERKRMSMLYSMQQKNILFVKGASDVITELSTSMIVNGQKISMTENDKKNIHQVNNELASQALRVLAVAYREIPRYTTEIQESAEQDLTFVALVAMMDPPRPEVKDAIKKCARAGIRTIMITGDHKETARAIGKILDIVDEKAETITGSELDKMSDAELKNRISRISIYARTTAEHKMRVVKAWQSRGDIVAVTGDGVNDAPAIQAANIGVAMGITGTEVTKEAADMIIVDDNFASIVNAVEEGRGIYDNIIKFVTYLLSANAAELLVIFWGTFFIYKDFSGNQFITLLPVQLLWLNLVTDGLPAIAFAMDPIDPRAMHQKPRNPNEKILSPKFITEILSLGTIITIGVLIACYIGLRVSPQLAHAMTLTSFVVLELVRVQMIRSRYNISFYSNKLMIFALISSLFLQLCIVYVPYFQRIFHIVPLGYTHWLIIIGIAIGVWATGILIDSFFAKLKV
jgi:Ca2+-transporting ATPase